MPTDRNWLDSLAVRAIGKDIDLSRFSCSANIDWWLRTVGLDFHNKRFSHVTCWLEGNDLAGYVATSMTTVEIIRQEQRERLGVQQAMMPTGQVMKHFPALLIGMLGTCDRYRRRGLATEMVRYAIGQALQLSDSVGCRFVTVDSDRTEEAVGLYRSCGFGEVEQRQDKDDQRKTVWMYYILPTRT